MQYAPDILIAIAIALIAIAIGIWLGAAFGFLFAGLASAGWAILLGRRERNA